MLALELPPTPLFQDEMESNIIPQVGLSTLFSRYNGKSCHEDAVKHEGVVKRYSITKFPRFLILYFRRYKKVKKGVEYNPTIVNFNQTHEFADGEKYRLVANICIIDGAYKVYLRKHDRNWVEVMDLFVGDTAWEMISLQASYIQFWEKI